MDGIAQQFAEFLGVLDCLDADLGGSLTGIPGGLDRDARYIERAHDRALPEIEVGDPVVRDDAGCPEPDAAAPAEFVTVEFVEHGCIIQLCPGEKQAGCEDEQANDCDAGIPVYGPGKGHGQDTYDNDEGEEEEEVDDKPLDKRFGRLEGHIAGKKFCICHDYLNQYTVRYL